ncbi:PEGA domain-containing protein [Sorangium sp. So ce388]|uniref:PEGA domain-containing protein n=1 Tax=Sorangium sp. So ce388 TaxID=3133309 RepID=UPI003F5B59A1
MTRNEALRTGACIVVMISGALAGAQVAQAQPQEPVPPPASAADQAPAQADDAEKRERDRQEAQAHFQKGNELMDQQAWAAALAEFSVSRRLYPTQNATYNAALCLRHLQRFDEALETYEALVREFPQLSPGDKAEALRAIDDLRGLVGTLEITAAQPGASIVVDGRERGDYPPVNPIRVAAGTHTVRVYKEGYVPFETRVEVAGGQTASVPAKLLVLTDAGRLRVTEQTGKSVNVVIDGVVVGMTPWEGDLAVGDRTVVLRGEGNLGTAPVGARIQARQRTTLSLRAEELDALLHVDPTPAGATVFIDAVPVGSGTWEGALRTGAHRIEVRYAGYVPAKRQVNLARGQQERIAISLERDPEAEVWRKPSKITFDVNAGFALVPWLGGDVAGDCTGGCEGTVGLGGLGLFNAGYEFGSGFSFGGTLGYLTVFQQTEGRTSTIEPVGLAARPITVDDALRMSTFVVAATAGQRFFESVPLSLRFGAGVALGSVRDARSETTRAPQEGGVQAYPTADAPSATYLYLSLEARLSKRFGDRFELGAGVQGLMLVALTQPKLDDRRELWTKQPEAGFFTYPDDALTGSTIAAIVPGVNVRYAF